MTFLSTLHFWNGSGLNPDEVRLKNGSRTNTSCYCAAAGVSVGVGVWSGFYGVHPHGQHRRRKPVEKKVENRRSREEEKEKE
ncbi:unnamed protein product [Calypogeia fissa]